MISQVVATILVLISPHLLNGASFLTNAVNAPNQNFPVSYGPQISAKSAIVLNTKNNKVLYEKNPDLVLPIASITKLVSALVFLEHNNLDWNEMVEIKPEDFKFQEESPYTSVDAFESGLQPKQLNVRPGNKMKVSDIFNAGLIGSLNNLLKTLARITEKNGKTFPELMNKKAENLGMKNSNFIEPTGLSPKNYSTAHDLIVLIQEAMNNSYLKKTLQREKYFFQVYSNGQKVPYNVKNTDELLNTFIKFKGGKTGYLDESGYCFVGISEFENKNLAVAVLNSDSDKSRFQEAKSLIWWSANQINEKPVK